MNRKLTTTLALLAGVTLALGAALPANASSRGNDAPPPTSTEEKPAVEPIVTPPVVDPPVVDSQVEVLWLLPETVTTLPTGNTPAIWPQTYLPNGESSIPCGRFAQADTYKQSDANVLTADNTLTEGEDYSVVISWRFIAGATCPIDVPPVKTTAVCDGLGSNVSTNLDPNGWSTTGDVNWIQGGVELSVPGDWATAKISRAFGQPISQVGTAIDFAATPSQYVGIHLRTAQGSIAFEKAPGYGDNWWSEADFGVGAGMGYASFASLADYVAANPDLIVNSIDVLYTSPTASSTVLTSATFGCTVYTFDHAVAPVVVTTTPELPETLAFTGATTDWLIWPGLAVLILGAGLTLAGRRKAARM